MAKQKSPGQKLRARFKKAKSARRRREMLKLAFVNVYLIGSYACYGFHPGATTSDRIAAIAGLIVSVLTLNIASAVINLKMAIPAVTIDKEVSRSIEVLLSKPSAEMSQVDWDETATSIELLRSAKTPGSSSLLRLATYRAESKPDQLLRPTMRPES